jgi:hypothetical protein
MSVFELGAKPMTFNLLKWQPSLSFGKSLEIQSKPKPVIFRALEYNSDGEGDKRENCLVVVPPKWELGKSSIDGHSYSSTAIVSSI